MLDEERERRGRLTTILQSGEDPFPARVTRSHTLDQVRTDFSALEQQGTVVSVVGRIRNLRRHGGVTFLRVEDGSGAFQIMFKIDTLGSERYEYLLATLDLGDFVEVSGTGLTTRTGEPSLLAATARIIAKALLPLPEKWHGLSDMEMRFRHRELDLIANPAVRDVFRDRARIISAIRRFFDARGFLEVDTPILQHVAAGASARPFVTHHNALDQDLYLRIAPELFLKRLVIGGYERVYEIARCFRNEGIDHAHNPEFSQVEAYIAYLDYDGLMTMMEELIETLITAIGKQPTDIAFGSNVLSFTRPFRRASFRDLILEKTSIDIDTVTSRTDAAAAAQRLGVSINPVDSLTTILDQIWKKTVRPSIIQPTFVVDYPAATTPLAKKKPTDPSHLEMFQLVMAGGLEVMKAFSELNDPIDQEQRMDEQEAAHTEGDEEAQRRDDDFLYAMKHGMPPMAGVGMGIERITQVLTGTQNIKEVLLFPTLRRVTGEGVPLENDGVDTSGE